MNPRSLMRRAARLSDSEFERLRRDRQVQIGLMIERGLRWKVEHPQAKPEINFIIPKVSGKDVALIGEIKDAIDRGYCKCNADGLEMVKALWPWRLTSSPTISMVQEVMEGIYAES